MAVVCGNCSGRLIFNPASQKLECASCGSSFRPEDVQDSNAELHSKYYDTRVYICSHCGAEVVTSDTEVSTFCVYCGNPAIVFNRIAKEYRPDGIIPFTVTKEDAIKYINLKFRKNLTVPKEVMDKVVPQNIRGIYIPYWIVNASFSEADYLVGYVKQGKQKRKEYYQRAGEVELKNLPVDGSKMLNDDVSSRLEPFYLEDSKVFDEDYLNGFYSNTSDTSYTDLRESTAKRCHKLYEEQVIKSIRADDVKIADCIYWVDIHNNPVYLMLPVWFFTFKYNDKPYTILVNGQTGKVVGTMPWVTKRVTTIAVGIFVALLTLFLLLIFGKLKGWEGFEGLYQQVFVLVFGFSSAIFATSLVGLNKIKKNLKLTQSEDIFKFVKKRQE